MDVGGTRRKTEVSVGHMSIMVIVTTRSLGLIYSNALIRVRIWLWYQKSDHAIV